MTDMSRIQKQVLYQRMVVLCEQATEYGALINGLCLIKGSQLEWDEVGDTRDGTTLLMWMVRDSRLNLASAIVIMSCVVDTRDNDGNTALSHAVNANNMGAAVLLLTQNAMINACNKGGDYPLAYAVYRQNRHMVQFLLMGGARVLDGKALHLAASHPAIFSDLVRDLTLETKYTSMDVDQIVNAQTTFCDVHGQYHNLWDYMPFPRSEPPKAALHETAMGLMRARGIEPCFKEPYMLTL